MISNNSPKSALAMPLGVNKRCLAKAWYVRNATDSVMRAPRSRQTRNHLYRSLDRRPPRSIPNCSEKSCPCDASSLERSELVSRTKRPIGLLFQESYLVLGAEAGGRWAR